VARPWGGSKSKSIPLYGLYRNDNIRTSEKT